MKIKMAKHFMALRNVITKEKQALLPQSKVESNWDLESLTVGIKNPE